MKRILIKIGTNLLTTSKGELDLNNLRTLVQQITKEINENTREFIIVTSGAITCGTEILKIKPRTIPDKQAAASIGQIQLMKEYSMFFGYKGISIGQILLTKEGLVQKEAQNNVVNTINTLIKTGVIPIINENDTVATDEIRFGDNDELSSIVGTLLKADLYIILTDLDGLFTQNPKKYKSATLVNQVEEVTEEILALASDTVSERSKGGMKSKLNAAKFAVENGIQTVIANGRTPNIIHDILAGKKVGTQFIAKKKRK